MLSGDASNWDNQALQNDILVDTTPTVGSIAQTDSGAGGLGHVAVVEGIHSDGTITVSESSYTESASSTWNFLWRHRTLSPSWFQHFIHVSSIPAGITQVNLNGALVSAEANGNVQVMGARIVSDTTDLGDYVVLDYSVSTPDLQLRPVSAKVYPDIGVVYRQESLFMKDVSPNFTLTRNGQTFNSGTTYNITATNEVPFHMNLEAGMSLSFRLANPSKNYHFIIQHASTGKIIRDNYLLQGSDMSTYNTAIFKAGEYLVFFQAENAPTMSVQMTGYNENRLPLVGLANGSSFSASFRAATVDYAKGRLSLVKGQTLIVARTGGSTDVALFLVYEDSTLSLSTSPGGGLSFIAPHTGDYYLAVRMSTALASGSYAGQITVSGPSMNYTTWRNLYTLAPGAEYANTDADGDGMPNFVEYAMDTDPLAINSPSQFQSLAIESGNAVFSVSKPKYATGAAHKILSGQEIRNLNNRVIQIAPHPSDAGKETISISDPLSNAGFYQLQITPVP